MDGPMEFHFLCSRGKVRNEADWTSPERPALWLYNLHYFDDLNAERCDERTGWHREAIVRWLHENPPAHGIGWDPYPLSLRVVNWIKASLWGMKLPDEAVESIAVQTRHLCSRMEYHLLGNHLLANAKALVFSGMFFQGAEASHWLKKGMQILKNQLPEQILPDGGHFELSPMYHLIVLEDVLDLIQLHEVYEKFVPDEFTAHAVAMLKWSSIMRHPDGEIPFFNDAAFGIAGSPGEVDSYARALNLPVEDSVADPENSNSCGYVRFDSGGARLIIDAAPVGPDYLPAHAHADTLSFELSLFYRRVVVNSGTSVYGQCPERQRQRGTSAHNTLVLDGTNSSDVWGGFRVGRRARITQSQRWREGGWEHLSASHDGFKNLPGAPTHKRQWKIKPGIIEIEDEVCGVGEHLAEVEFHLHPDIHPEELDGGIWALRGVPGNARIQFPGGRARCEPATFHPEFGVSVPNRKFILEAGGRKRIHLRTRLTWEPVETRPR